jgi:hypothetical protein
MEGGTMAFVPVSTPPTYPPSPRTRELAGLLSKVLEEYTRAHPSVTKAEIRSAIRMAQMSAGPDRGKVAVLLALALGIGVAGLLMGLLLYQGAEGGGSGTMSSMVIAAVIALVAVMMVMVKLQSR